MGRLDGKVALISGGARGQGGAEVKLFAQEGARVIFGDVLDDVGRELEAEVRAAGGDARYLHLDVTRESDWEEAVGTAVQLYGQPGYFGEQRRYCAALQHRRDASRRVG